MRFSTLISILLLLASVRCSVGEDSALHLRIPDVPLVDQDGQRVHFLSDVVKDRIAVIDTIFTTCTTICPGMGSNYSRLASDLSGRLGKDVILVSVSVDPVNDTPAQLKAWSAHFYTGPGWVLLTGPKPSVDVVLKSLGLYTPERQNHQSTMLIGSSASGWTRASSLVSADKWLKIIDSIGPAKSASNSYHPKSPPPDVAKN